MALELSRLFFALWPGADVRDACLARARELRVKMQPGGRLIDPERYHITLAFLGHTVSAGQEALARQAAERVRAVPFTLTLDHASCFRKRQAPWWLGARELPPALEQLHAQLHQGLVEAQLQLDRARFTPHLTILRDANAPLPQTPVRPVAWDVRDFVLVRSHLDRQPVEYEIVGRWTLSPEGGSGRGQMNLWDNDASN